MSHWLWVRSTSMIPPARMQKILISKVHHYKVVKNGFSHSAEVSEPTIEVAFRYH